MREFKVDDFGAPPYPELVLCVSRETLDDDRALVAATVRALRRGYEETINDPESAVEALVDRAARRSRRHRARARRRLARVHRGRHALRRARPQGARSRWAQWEARFGITKQPAGRRAGVRPRLLAAARGPSATSPCRRRAGAARAPASGSPCSSQPPSMRSTSPSRASPVSAVVTDGRRAPTSVASVRCGSPTGSAHAIGAHAAPALGQRPEQHDHAVVDARQLRDRALEGEAAHAAHVAGVQRRRERGPAARRRWRRACRGSPRAPACARASWPRRAARRRRRRRPMGAGGRPRPAARSWCARRRAGRG